MIGRCIKINDDKIHIEDMGDGFIIEETTDEGKKTLRVRKQERYRIFFLLAWHAIHQKDQLHRLAHKLKEANYAAERAQKAFLQLEQQLALVQGRLKLVSSPEDPKIPS